MFGSPPAIDPSIVRDVVARGVLIQSERGVLIKPECPVLIAPDWGVLNESEWGVSEKSDYPVLITPEYSLNKHFSAQIYIVATPATPEDPSSLSETCSPLGYPFCFCYKS